MKTAFYTLKKLSILILILMACFSLESTYGMNNNSNNKNGIKSMDQTVNKTEADLDHQILIYLNSLYIQSYIRSDIETFDKLLWAQEFTQTNPDGSVSSREKVMENFGQPRFDKIIYLYTKDVKVEFLSEDKAVVSAINPDCFEIDGKLIKSISSYKDTYVKRDGKWKCISAVIKNVD